VLLEFFINIIVSSHTMTMGLTQPLKKKRVPGIFPAG